MGAHKRRYVGKPIPGDGWPVWDTALRRWRGNVFADYPAMLPDGPDRVGSPERLTEFARRACAPKS
ncbi:MULTISPECIES: hypothetical protein [Lysobacter]|uniref:Uncharacterized protein n=1 Tax=Lysobacter firmicutimachus TaxID=1792846 RepID=A0ABU8D8X7_9GAMM|nr:hypothetical protein [Lysobacter antibioticus]